MPVVYRNRAAAASPYDKRMTLAFDALDAPASPLVRLDPRWKLAALAAAGVMVSFLRTPAAICVAGAGALILVLAAQLPRRLLRPRFGALALFLLPFVIILPVMRGFEGLQAVMLLSVRAGTLFVVALVLIATAPFHLTMQAAQVLGVPRVLTQIILMSYRYVFVLRDEFLRIRTALRARGFRAGTTSHTYRTVGHVAGMLLVRGDERAERVAQAMRSRGFDGRFRSMHEFRTRLADVVFFVLVAGVSGALLAADRLLWA
jgi:cobalt/nickel transport system permease protein